MELLPRLFFWSPLRKLLGLAADNYNVGPVQTRTLLYEFVESEICVADALLDLNDFEGCSHHLEVALKHAQQLRGPESFLMHQRLTLLKEKRAEYHVPKHR